MPNPLAETFRQAAGLNSADSRRQGNVLSLAAGCDVIVSGDVHGHRRNLTRIITYADLGKHPDRRLILQEIVHGPPDRGTGQDRSIEALLRAARLKIAHPNQVVLLLGNHDVAQITGSEITKAGRGVCEAFGKGVEYACGANDAPEVLEAVKQYLLSQPLAVRCPGAVLITHSLPSPRKMRLAGSLIPGEAYCPENLRRGGKVYEWTWGRGQTAKQIERLADRLGVEFFILAHRHIETGYEIISRRAIALTTEHDRGCIMQFSSDATMTDETVAQHIKPVVALTRGS